MGMAKVATYPKPVVRKVKGQSLWRVKYCSDMANAIYYRDFYFWNEAIAFATGR